MLSLPNTHTAYIELDGGMPAGREGAGKERGRMEGGREGARGWVGGRDDVRQGWSGSGGREG